MGAETHTECYNRLMESPESPILTVVFPVYKDHDFLRRALTALKRQTFRSFKVVIIDNASPVGFDALREEFKAEFPVEITRNETNIGAMPNMLKSITFPVDTKYILSQHADDFLKSDYLEQAILLLEKNPSISWVTTGPEWVSKDITFTEKRMDSTEYITFDAAEFAEAVLNFTPFIFGAVIYRKEQRIYDWKFNLYDVFCDRFMLGTILEQFNAHGAFFTGRGIFERDHTLDVRDDRGSTLTPTHAINLLSFYRGLLTKKFPRNKVDVLSTNAALYYLSTFPRSFSLRAFLKEQKPHHLISIHAIRGLGLYALFTRLLSNSAKLGLLRFRKRIKNLFHYNRVIENT